MLATPSDRYIFGTVPWYSVLIATGILFALWWACREEKRLHLPKDTMVDLALHVVPLGVVGARLYYVLFAWDTFAPNPVSILYIWQGGMAIYGGIIGGVIGAIWFCRKRRLSLLMMLDAIAPGVAMAQAIGRWGNYFNMEAYGAEIINPALQFFPLAVLIPGVSGGTWHMATFFYESVWNLLVFTVLAALHRRAKRDGDVLAWYALLYGAGRMVIEGLRMDSLMAGSTVRVSQLLSAALCVAAVVWFLVRSPALRTKRTAWSAAAAGAVWLALSVVLSGYPDVFPGYTVILAVASVLAAAVCAAQRTAWTAIPPLAALIACHAVRIWLPVGALEPVVAGILLCVLLAATLIASGASVYASLPARKATPKSQTL